MTLRVEYWILIVVLVFPLYLSITVVLVMRAIADSFFGALLVHLEQYMKLVAESKQQQAAAKPNDEVRFKQ